MARRYRVGIPKVLNIWSTHQFWIGLLTALRFKAEQHRVSSDTSEEQFREFGKGRGTVDCCCPVKCMSGHYGHLLLDRGKKIDILLSPMIYSLPSFSKGACDRHARIFGFLDFRLDYFQLIHVFRQNVKR